MERAAFEQLPLGFLPIQAARHTASLEDELLGFREFGQQTKTVLINGRADDGQAIGVSGFVNEFWTARQRQACSLHEISYRACFKPQLPRFFIERLTVPGEVVYDPFMGRGTTLLEAALLGRVPWGNDANPLSVKLIAPRLRPPTLQEVSERLGSIDLNRPDEIPEELLAFYHVDTLRAIVSLRSYLLERQTQGNLDPIDEWIAMVALNRLTGHSKGFFSVYTLPPNQAVSVKSQLRINQKRNQTPPLRDVRAIILKKSKQLLGDIGGIGLRAALSQAAGAAKLVTCPADGTTKLPSGAVSLVVTSPPFLNIVQYSVDNWLRCWFAGIDTESVALTTPRTLTEWQSVMTAVLRELYRLLKPGGHVAFEVGEVHKGTTRLEETVLACGTVAGLHPLLVLINDQKFTKTANCWGISNMSKGTNTNRVVLFRK